MKKGKQTASVLNRRKGLSMEWKNTLQLGVLTLPVVIWFIVFSYIPMFGVVLAFKNFEPLKGIWGSDWCGFDNFAYLFGSNDAFRILRNTIGYNLVSVVIQNFCAISVALLLNNVSKKSVLKVYQTSMFLPYFVSWVVVAFITEQLFSYNYGALNGILTTLGFEKYSWYSETKPWPIILMIANVWKAIGFNSVIYYGAIIGIDESLIEAAKIDGASHRQVTYKIILPLLKPAISILLIMAVGNMLRADFGLFYYVPNNTGMLYPVTDVIDTYIYRALKIAGDFGGSSAASFFQSVVGLVLVVTANTITKKIDEESALF